MSKRRTYGSYNDGCAAAHALDLVGDRWTMIVVRELLLGSKRFTQLQHDIAGIGPTALAQRLHDLEEHGIATHDRLPLPSGVEVYELTEWGHQLEAVNTALSQWAVSSPEFPWDADMSPDTLILAMRSHARPVATEATPVRVDIRLLDSRRQEAEPVSYRATMHAAGTDIERLGRDAEPAAATIETTTRALKNLVVGGQALELVADIRVHGSATAARLLLEATSLERP